jgi:Zn-dependent peptidase ImmA (M78 family)
VINKFEYSLIQQQAVKILEEYQFNKLPIDPKLLAEKANIIVEPKDDCEKGVSGMLLRNREDYRIFYATYLGNLGFENFSIAHELGHFFIGGHPERIFKLGNMHKSSDNFMSDNEIERQADAFAASLLMPEILFKDKMTEYEKGLTCIEAMSMLCITSLTATAIRYTELTDDKVIVIVSTNGIINYCFLSKSVFELRDIEIPKKGDKIPKGTATEKISNDPSFLLKPDSIYQETDFRDWIECKKPKNAAEEVKGLGKYGKILTVIS